MEGKTDPSTGKSIEEVREALIEQLAEAQDQLHVFDRNVRRKQAGQIPQKKQGNSINSNLQQSRRRIVSGNSDANQTSLDITRQVEQQVSLQREMEQKFNREKAEMEKQFEKRMQQVLTERDMTSGRIGSMHKETIDKMKNEAKHIHSKYTVLKEKAKEQ